MDILDLHAHALDETARIIEGITPDQMMAPTPCTEWNVRALLNHLVGGNQRFAGMPGGGSGMPSPAAPTQVQLGDDPAGAYRVSAEALKQAWRQPGALDAMYTLPVGMMPGSAVVRLHTVETVTHGWDLARATGQPVRFDTEVVAAAQKFIHSFPPQRGPGSPFGDAVPAADDLSDIDRLAAWMGRQL